jgi:hypothetical protein
VFIFLYVRQEYAISDLLIQARSAVMFQKTTMAVAVAAATLLLAACGGSNGDNNGAVIAPPAPTTGILAGTPTTTAVLTAAQFNGALQASASGQQLLQLTGAPTCGVAVSHIEYNTTGAAGEPTTASGALMVPTGTDPKCSGKRPVVLYAHGTTIAKSFNMAALVDPNNAAQGESTLVAATFAAQGYIVIAPNYAGYDTSTLNYHPYVQYKQQSQDMIDALRAGRTGLTTVPAGAAATDSGQLFVTGYSEGGYVAMATLKAMDAQRIPVTAGAPMSGPYSLAAYGDAVFYGNTPLGGTVFAPLLTTGYQKAYKNIYAAPSDAYASPFATNIETLLPSSTLTSFALLFGSGALPQTALFQSAPTGIPQLDALSPADPKFSFGFAPNGYLINTAYRAGYLVDAQAHPDGVVPVLNASNPLPAAAPQNTLRQALKLNDLRGYAPSMPVLMCGGNSDPTVFFAPNSQVMAGILGNIASSGVKLKFALLDVDTTTAASAGFSSVGLSATATGTLNATATGLQAGFANALTATVAGAPAQGQHFTDAVTAAVVAGHSLAEAQGIAAVQFPDGATFASTYQKALAAGAPAAQASAIASNAVASSNYHGGLVPPFCTTAARTFFQQF